MTAWRRPLHARIRAGLAAGPKAAGRALVRERERRRLEGRLDRAVRAGSPVVVGPFTGEVGYELLYWIPFVRRRLHDLRVPRESVVVVTRGGAGAWYDDVAAQQVEILDLLDPAELRAGLLERRRREAELKQTRLDALDAEILRRAGLTAVALLHPASMVARLRYVWGGQAPLELLDELTEQRPLARSKEPIESLGLPTPYVAVKAYWNDVLPDSEATRAFVRDMLAEMARETNVVLVGSGVALDEHEEPPVADGLSVRTVVPDDPARNLGLQAAVVAGADALVATYGGFSYLGPLLGVPTVAVAAVEAAHTRHLEVLRHSCPGAEYEVVDVTAGPAAVAAAVRTAGAGA